MTDRGGHLMPSTRAPAGEEDTWGPYWDALFPPRLVTSWINWKRMSNGVNVARRLWDQREYLRGTCEPSMAPTGVVTHNSAIAAVAYRVVWLHSGTVTRQQHVAAPVEARALEW